MSVCAFFGHKDSSWLVEHKLEILCEELIINRQINMFYMGNNGNFDIMARRVVRKLKEKYPHINYYVVLAYHPTNRDGLDIAEYADTILPQGIENSPPRYAIAWRNKWIVKQAEYVITNITHNFGGAFQFAELAKRKGKTVINIADDTTKT